MMLVAGIRDVRLKEKLSEMEGPTLPAFTTIIDAHLYAKATAGITAVVNKVFTPGGNRKKGQNKQGGGQSGQGQQRSGIGDAEKKKRMVMKGKCYRCGSGDHMANNCQVAKDIKCRSFSSPGHIAAASLPTYCISESSRRKDRTGTEHAGSRAPAGQAAAAAETSRTDQLRADISQSTIIIPQ